MKMQVLYIQKKEGVMDNAEIVADRISRAYKCKSDKIPPAYPCDNEKLVILVFENYGSLDKKLLAFCKDLSGTRAQNVALIALTKDGSADVGELEGIFKAHNVKIVDKCGIAVKKGLFSAAKITDAQVDVACKWAHKIVSGMFDSVN